MDDVCWSSDVWRFCFWILVRGQRGTEKKVGKHRNVFAFLLQLFFHFSTLKQFKSLDLRE
jgi:hypothetical protein